MGSPLGKYSDVAATIVVVFVVLAWLAIHGAIAAAALIGHTIGTPPDTTQLDLAATLVLGVVLGQRATTNGATQVAQSANPRLDAIGAPSAAAASVALATGLAPVAPILPPPASVG